MTAVTSWRDPSVKPRRPGPLPEPPRTHHLSKSSARPTDGMSRELEAWLDGLTISRTADAE
ncbi:MAG: hypothetical protein M3R54_06900 [Chloroflexota bacterium]|nr:hypothetical protein [Chloroflexota bacterium]